MIDLVIKALRTLFVLIDQIVVFVMNGAYSLLMKLSTYNIVSTDAVKSFGQRIGVILGIFMLFTIAIQLLNYIISPEKFSDKSKGGAKLIKNVVVSLVLLGVINVIFEVSYKVQYKIIEKQIIPQIIFGVKQTEKDFYGENQQISYYLFTTMININEDVIPECKSVYSNGFNDGCRKVLESTLSKKGYDAFGQAVVRKDAYLLLEQNNLTTMKNGEFVFNYRFLFSTIIAVLTTLILLGFCLDVSVRMVKLYFYQIIAPIPIISNMIPGKGQEMFKKWYKACASTYVDIFIRLIALFFATYVITVAWDSIVNTIGDSHFLLGVFIILGSLMFASQLPQIVQDLTGLKLDGTFSVNPLKKIQKSPLAAGVLGYAGARLGGAAANVWGAHVQNENVRKQLAAEGLTKGTAAYNARFKDLNGNTIGGYIGSAIAGSHSAGIRSLWTGITGGGNKTISQITSSGITGASRARNRRDAGYNMRSKALDLATDVAQIKNDYGTTDKLKGEVKKYQQDLENAKQQENVLSQSLTRQMGNYSEAMAALSKVFDNSAIRDENGKFLAYKVKTYNDFLEEQAKQKYINDQISADASWVTYSDEERVNKKKQYTDNWYTLTAPAKTTKMNDVRASGVLSEDQFNELNNVYNSKNEYDVQARDLEKKMKSAQENMAKQNGNK